MDRGPSCPAGYRPDLPGSHAVPFSNVWASNGCMGRIAGLTRIHANCTGLAEIRKTFGVWAVELGIPWWS
jgi:hypothetical protein